MSNFVIEMALNAAGLSAAEKAQVEAALPAANEMVTLVNANQPFLQKILQLWATVGPAMQIISQHLAPSAAPTETIWLAPSQDRQPGAPPENDSTAIHGIRFVDGKFVTF